MYNSRKLGAEKEKMAGEYLSKLGYEILTYNFYSKMGEIDIVAREQGYLVFIEVKYRSNIRNGLPQDAINRRKIVHVTQTAQYYMLRNGISVETPCRFDVVTILGKECQLIRDAFEAVGID